MTSRFLSIGRWLIFILPALGAGIYALPFALSGAWQIGVFAIDCCVIALLIAAIRASMLEQLAWATAG